MERVFLLEDDESLTEGLCYVLEKNGFQVEAAATVEAGFSLLEQYQYDLLLLDITLPDGTGYDVCRWVRQRDSRIPILFLTALDEEVNIIRGLDGGGDDYITKPFKLGELCSRMRALLRRAKGTSVQGKLSSGNIAIDPIQGAATLRGEKLELTAGETRLLTLLIRNSGRTLSRQAILDALWDGQGRFVDDNTLSVYIRRLREKVEEDPSEPKRLLTVRGIGYTWKEEEACTSC